MQMAQAGVKAITRAELLKFVRVSVLSAMRDATQSDGTTTVEHQTLETVRERLPGFAPVAVGWVEVERDGKRLLRLLGRIEVTKQQMNDILRENLEPALAQSALTVLFRANYE